MKTDLIEKAYAVAKERYAAIGVDTDEAIALLEKQQISLHCWQADDVVGFERNDALSGGIQTTGNYPGRARNIDEVRKDIEFVKTLIAGNHRLNLHEIYGDFGGKFVDRDQCGVEHFQSWIDWAKANNMKLDFNSTSFSHPKSGSLSLSNPDQAIRDFWIEHTKRCRRIADAMGKAQGDPCIMNIWVHDGSKDVPVQRKKYRELLADSLDQIMAEKLDGVKNCFEAKLFGIGLESYTVGSHDFYTAYCATRKQMYTLDTGHYEQTENVSDFVSTLLMYVPELMLHVSRPVRWDSDHVTIMDDPTQELFFEIVRADALDRVHYGLDFFDGSINRLGAYVISSRAAQKCMLRALLEPRELISRLELAGEGYKVLTLIEEQKAMPWQAVYDEFCVRNNVPVGADFITEIDKYVADVISKR